MGWITIFPDFSGAAVEVWEWTSNLIPHFTGYVITYPCWDISSSIPVKGAPVLWSAEKCSKALVAIEKKSRFILSALSFLMDDHRSVVV